VRARDAPRRAGPLLVMRHVVDDIKINTSSGGALRREASKDARHSSSPKEILISLKRKQSMAASGSALLY
jgi:hypothetical protein